MMRSYRLLFLAFAVLAATACSGAPQNTPGTSRDPDMISTVEIDPLRSYSVHEIIQRLRPRWLQVRSNSSLSGGSSEILVYQGQMRLGGVDMLRSIRGAELLRLRWLDTSEAVAQLPGIGSMRPAGVILLEMRAGT
jgi:hypothetical protein